MKALLCLVRTVLVGVILLVGVRASARDNIPPQLQHLGVTEHLDAPLPLDAIFRDQDGKQVRLGEYFGKKPVVLVLAYHSCPTFCGMVLRGLSESLREVPWTVGNEYQVLVVSIDPRDKPEAAAAKRDLFIGQYGRSKEGSAFLVGETPSITRLASALGFEYEFDKQTNQYKHPAVIFVAKPSGGVARYLYGVTYAPTDVRLSLLEAAHEKSLTTVERVLLFCFHYDPNEGKYVLMARQLMKIAGALTAILLFSFLAVMWRRERVRSLATPTEAAKSIRTDLKEAT